MMVDDQDRCEWVNVSSGTNSPGQSRTKGHKTVTVFVVVEYCISASLQQFISLFICVFFEETATLFIHVFDIILIYIVTVNEIISKSSARATILRLL